MRLRLGAAVLLGALLWVRPPTTAADEPAPPSGCPSYAPVPPGLAALVGTAADEERARVALLSVEDPDPATAAHAARELLLSGDQGLKGAAERLASGKASLGARLRLLPVLAASRRSEVDVLLAAAALESRPELRMLAAHGLGAGRSGLAVEVLARLARDPVSGVRAAALRALFAIETPTSLDTRASLPDDRDPELRTLRLALHRLRGDAGGAIARRAVRSFALGATSAERLAGVRLMAAQSAAVPELALALAVLELGGDATSRTVARAVLGHPAPIRDRGQGRLAAAEALLALLAGSPAEARRRDGLLDLAVEWLAHPEREQGRQVDEEARTALFSALPDAGRALVEPVSRRLRANAFEDPAHGVRLLLGLEKEVALSALQALARDAAMLEHPVLGALSAGFGELERIGDRGLARALTSPEMLTDVRVSATKALAGDDDDVAWPLLEGLLRDADAAVSSEAKEAVERRGGDRARRLLEKVLLEGRWPEGRWPRWAADAVHVVATPADPAAYEFLDRALTKGRTELREAVFAEIAHVPSPLRGPAAVRLVRRGIDEPQLGFDVGQIAQALAPVDGPAAVVWVRDHWRTWRSPEVLVRNLQVVTDRSALDFVLGLAAGLSDKEDGLLNSVITVVCGACPKVPAQTDPFFRRLLDRGSPSVRQSVIDVLPGVPHGPMAKWLVPWIADRTADATVRRKALLACAPEREQPTTALLWKIASDRTEDCDLRPAAAVELLRRGDPRLRPLALAWLSEKIDEWSDAVERIAELAGHGASPSEASDLLQLLRDDLAQHYRQRPYYHRRRGDDEDEALANRASALIRAIGASGDPASLDAVAAHLFDPRFATWASEAARYSALRRASGGGPFSPLADPPALGVLLRHAEEDPNETPIPPIPPEAAEIVEALARRGPEEAAQRLARALTDAEDTGRLAAFQDLYLLWLATGFRDPGPRRERPPADAAARQLEDALVRTAPSCGAEELVALDRRRLEAERAGRFEEAAERAREVSALAARTGLMDIPPARWLDAGRAPEDPPWRVVRARVDLLLGAAAAAAGKPDEARDAFLAGVARAPNAPETLREAATLMARTRFDLQGAEARARRAAELERREGDPESQATRDALSAVEAAKR